MAKEIIVREHEDEDRFGLKSKALRIYEALMAGDIGHEQAQAAVSALREVTKLEAHALKLATFANIKATKRMKAFGGFDE